jgi:hypothetical protein
MSAEFNQDNKEKMTQDFLRTYNLFFRTRNSQTLFVDTIFVNTHV